MQIKKHFCSLKSSLVDNVTHHPRDELKLQWFYLVFLDQGFDLDMQFEQQAQRLNLKSFFNIFLS